MFTASDWETAADGQSERARTTPTQSSETLTIRHAVSGGDYGGLVTAADVGVTLVDNNTAEPRTISTSGVTIKEGSTGTFTGEAEHPAQQQRRRTVTITSREHGSGDR